MQQSATTAMTGQTPVNARDVMKLARFVFYAFIRHSSTDFPSVNSYPSYSRNIAR
jgi:hypothetical protein